MTGAPWATLPRPVGEVLDELEVRRQSGERLAGAGGAP
jgi:hypothetical protein